MNPRQQYFKWAEECKELENQLLMYSNMGEAAKAEPKLTRDLIVRIGAMGGTVEPQLIRLLGIKNWKKTLKEFIANADREN